MHAMSENPPKTLVRSAETNPRLNEEVERRSQGAIQKILKKIKKRRVKK